MKAIISVLMYLIFFSIEVLSQTPYTSPDSWKLLYEENFDNLDPNSWIVQNDFDHYGEPQVYTDRSDNVYISNGNLVLKINEENYQCTNLNDWACNKEFYDYTSGWVETTNTMFKYGYLESRIKLPYGYGFWPAFWTFIASGVLNPHNAAEIDIFEMGGHKPPTTMGTNLHMRYCDEDSYDWDPVTKTCTDLPSYGQDVTIPSYANVYRKYAVAWSPTTFKWYVDDVLVREFPNPGIIDPVRIILNLAITPWALPNESTPFPSRMYIDYVRVYGLKLKLYNEIVAINQSKDYYASYSISLAGNNTYYIVDGNNSNGGNLTLEAANTLTFKNGFQVKKGGHLKATLDDFKTNGTKSAVNEPYRIGDNPNNIQENMILEEQSIKSNDIMIFPNPSYGLFTVSSKHEIQMISIIDLMGKTWYNQNFNQKQIEVSMEDIPKGTYFVKIVTNDRSFTKYIIHQ